MSDDPALPAASIAGRFSIADRSLRDRTPRLRDWTVPVNGLVRTARCTSCGHAAALPVAQMLRRFDGRTPIADLQARMVCSRCGGRAIDIRIARLCEPGCPKQRG